MWSASDDEHVGAFLPGDDRPGRHRDDIRLDLELDRQAHILAGPELRCRRSELGLRRHGAGKRIDGVVDERTACPTSAIGVLSVLAARTGCCPRRASPELIEVALGHRKADEDRLDLVDHDERHAARLHEVPLTHEQTARATRRSAR